MLTNLFHTERQAINNAFLTDETDLVQGLRAQLKDYQADDVVKHACQLVTQVRKHHRQSPVQAFLQEYQLNSTEGIVLMSIAEALMRIPDRATQDRFLADRLSAGDWYQHRHHSASGMVNLATYMLALSGGLERQAQLNNSDSAWFHSLFEHLVARLGQPMIRSALKQAMQLLGEHFVKAETIEEAIDKANKSDPNQYSMERYSFDMLGEAAITAGDAERYFVAYQHAIDQLAAKTRNNDAECHDDLYAWPGVSVKLSALYPRYESLQHSNAVPELTAKLLKLATCARNGGITLTIDAEESERLEMSLDIFEAVFTHPELEDWPGFGLAVQAYQKRAMPILRWLAVLAEHLKRKIPVRLVKGAYWDSEIKHAQENGLDNYPVFTRKSATDISYLACAQWLLNNPHSFFPQFATHNAHTVAAVMCMARHSRYEFQRLHGMGEALYHVVMIRAEQPVTCRVYAPVGNYQDLLPYLVRRLLENGANMSFIHQVENPQIAVDEVIRDPVATWFGVKNAGLLLPEALYGDQRRNSQGLNLADPQVRSQIKQELDELAGKRHRAMPLINGKFYSGPVHPVITPHDPNERVGEVVHADHSTVKKALNVAADAANDWRLFAPELRAACLQKAADIMEQQRMLLVSLCVREGGRTIKDALAEVREAVDFCRYYAASALELFQQPIKLPGPVGEKNDLRYYGRGVFICISPWNFPIAIFTGQIAAALAAGNTVIAKPAERTALTAMACTRILHQAGIPESVLHFLPGKGSEIGAHLLTDLRIAGLVFTGSTVTAQWINRQLASHPVIVPFIAETGGQNIMIADSSAHKEQLVQDVIMSAFNSAGQRCSALRVLFVPHETADTIIDMLKGAIDQLNVGDPGDITVDIGPVITQNATQQLAQHVESMRKQRSVLYQHPIVANQFTGSFFPPTLIEIADLLQLKEEVFGPVLHIIRYSSGEMDTVINAVNATGYGLTFGIHSRIQRNIEYIRQRVKVGNIYINRNMIGAVVGAQPFGGMGLSGTGPKAGGPDYLRRFAVEQTVSENIAAIGGDTNLLSQDLR